jgi:hypothetical protein
VYCLPCRYVALRVVLYNASFGYVALTVVCCLPCGYVALRVVLYKVSLRSVALALVCCFPCGYVALRAMLYKASLGYVASSTCELIFLYSMRKSRVIASSCGVDKPRVVASGTCCILLIE